MEKGDNKGTFCGRMVFNTNLKHQFFCKKTEMSGPTLNLTQG